VTLDVAQVTAEDINPQDSSLCIANAEGTICFNTNTDNLDDIPEQISGLKVLSTVTDKNNEPLKDAEFILAHCGHQGETRLQYEVKTDSLGEIELIVQDADCFSLEVQAQTDSHKAFAFSDSLKADIGTSVEIEMTLPVDISGKMALSQFSADQQFYVGLEGTKRSLILKNGDTFVFVDVPKDIEYFFFHPFNGDINDQAVAYEVYNAIPAKFAINKKDLNELRKIEINFISE
jgi:hypothetical protein